MSRPSSVGTSTTHPVSAYSRIKDQELLISGPGCAKVNRHLHWIGMVNGLVKNQGLPKFQLNCKHFALSFSEQFFASQSLKFLAQLVLESFFFYLTVLGTRSFYEAT